ncbi:hypothetical protein SAMN04489841_3431 [Natrinema salaciae]|uniref:IclR helix-turn-helix domain-containing protein n=1 Tax=Natrinema salaciae TaxID=1186196 RepID=A0A1H9MNL6_9EURY|nr:hypothetical protein SAMN04489841_3431 [Natrinema salaciae]
MIESRFLVTNESEAESFRNYAETVVTDREDEPYDRQTFQEYADRASESTGREMSIENAGWAGYRIEKLETDGETNENVRVGIITYSFTWTNFATVDGDRIHVGDTFEATPLFRQLNDGQRLVIESPDNYGFVNTPTSTVDGALIWDGPHEFGPNDLQITILRGAGPNGPSVSGLSWQLVVLIALVGLVIVAGSAGYILAQRDSLPSISLDRLQSLSISESLRASELLERHGSTEDDRGPVAVNGNSNSEPVPTTTTDPSVSSETKSGTQLEFEEPGYDGVDPELLSDEERVLRLLKRNGGRMKQASIVSETGWSNAKVSQLLSKMDDDDEIEKLRIGRENLITLPGVDPTELD